VNSPQDGREASRQGVSPHGDVGARLMLVLLCFIWGSTWPIFRIALTDIPVFSMRAASSGIGALTLYLICRAMGRSFHMPNAKAWLHTTISSLLTIVCFITFSSFAVLASATSRVVILAYAMPIWAVILAWPVLHERPTRTQIVALLLCIVGIVILIYPLAGSGIPLGMILGLATGATWAAGTVYLKWAQIKADPMGVASWQMTIAFVIVLILLLMFEGRFHFERAGTEALAATAYAGVVGNGVAYALWFEIIRRLPTMTASIGVLSVPMIGIVCSIFMLGEIPTATDIVGFALICAASVIAMLSRPAPASESGAGAEGAVTP
jgi:drug/metabolite transporter (DMT)-like permease